MTADIDSLEERLEKRISALEDRVREQDRDIERLRDKLHEVEGDIRTAERRIERIDR